MLPFLTEEQKNIFFEGPNLKFLFFCSSVEVL